MTHREFMKKSLCQFQFVPGDKGSFAIDTNFNFYFITKGTNKETLISMIKYKKEWSKNIAVLNHSMPFMTFESEALNTVMTLIAKQKDYPKKIEKLYEILEEYKWKTLTLQNIPKQLCINMYNKQTNLLNILLN